MAMGGRGQGLSTSPLLPHRFSWNLLQQPALERVEARWVELAGEGLADIQLEERSIIAADRAVDAHLEEEDVRRGVPEALIATCRCVAVARSERMYPFIGVQIPRLIGEFDRLRGLARKPALRSAHLPFEVGARVVNGRPEEGQDVDVGPHTPFRMRAIAAGRAERVNGLVEAQDSRRGLAEMRLHPIPAGATMLFTKRSTRAFKPIPAAVDPRLRVLEELFTLVEPARRHVGTTHPPAVSTPQFAKAASRHHKKRITFVRR